MDRIIQRFDASGKDRYALLAVAGVGFVAWRYLTSPTRKINAPTIGTGGLFGAYTYMKDGRYRLQKGYDKYAADSGSFKIPLVSYWNIVVTGKNVDELRNAPDDVLSFEQAISDALAVPYTMGPLVVEHGLHVHVVKSQLTRSLPILLPDVLDEIGIGFEDALKFAPGQEWVKARAFSLVPNVVSRASNRIFVGVPTCRNEEYLKLNVKFALNVIVKARIINLFPPFIKPAIGWLLGRTPATVEKAAKFIRPLIEERKKLSPEDRPHDFVSWLLAETEARELDPSLDAKTRAETSTPEFLTLLILVVNFAAIHTSTMSFTHALYNLATEPEKYLGPLREEIEEVTKAHGWNKAGLVKMRKLDSFMRETQRFTGLGGTVMARKALRDFTFPDGTFVPKGHIVSTPLMPAHHDELRYPNADKFDGFRFAEMRGGEGDGSKYQMVATSVDYLPFGHGRHACPGRFFAANELKLMMAYLVMNYDIKLENEGVRPPNEWFGASCIPNRTAEVMFRRRQF